MSLSPQIKTNSMPFVFPTKHKVLLIRNSPFSVNVIHLSQSIAPWTVHKEAPSNRFSLRYILKKFEVMILVYVGHVFMKKFLFVPAHIILYALE